MLAEFAVDYRLNEDFDSLVALNFALEGSGAALMATSAFLIYPPGVLAGFVLVLLGIICLLFHLGNRLRSWRAITGLGSAWISRGVFFAGVLLFFGAYFLLRASSPAVVAEIGTVCFGLLTALYSGFLLASMTSIPFWNSPLTPVLFLLHSTTTGCAILTFMATSSNKIAGNRALSLTVVLASVTLLVTVIHITVMMNATNAARHSVKLLLSGSLKWFFVGGALMVGLVLPLIILGWMFLSDGQASHNATAVILFALALRILGDFTFRYSVLKAGVFERLI